MTNSSFRLTINKAEQDLQYWLQATPVIATPVINDIATDYVTDTIDRRSPCCNHVTRNKISDIRPKRSSTVVRGHNRSTTFFGLWRFFVGSYVRPKMLNMYASLTECCVYALTDCTADQFRCASGQCATVLSHCDGVSYCLDGSDQANCSE